MDIYEIINNRIVAELEKGNAVWVQDWKNVKHPRNYITGKSYHGLNFLMLSALHYSSADWLTFRQCQALKGKIKTGSKATPIIYWDFFYNIDGKNITPAEILKLSPEDKKKVKKVAFLKYYNVFNFTQTEGLKPKEEAKNIDFKPIEEADKIIAGYTTKPEIKHDEQRAYYSPTLDFINVPKPETFSTIGGYYATLYHELTHSTGHEKRLNRLNKTENLNFGSVDYSKEELVAELGSAYLCAIAGISNEKSLKQNAGYIGGWLKALKNDKKMLISASSKAQKSTAYIVGTE